MQNRWCYPPERMQKTLRQKCKNKRRIEASMAETFITEEAANFVTAHYEAKSRHLHNLKPRYNADDPKKGQSNLSLFKGNLAPASGLKPVSLDNKEWRTITLYIFNNLTEVRPYISSRYIVSQLLFPLNCSYSWINLIQSIHHQILVWSGDPKGFRQRV